jgi:hypothetical protein
MSIPLDELPPVAVAAWTRLADELGTILGQDLVALWAYGGTMAPDRPRRPGDLDTYAVLARPPDKATARRIDAVHAAIGREKGVHWDAWYVLADDARRSESPRHAFQAGRRDTSWAVNRAHWLAGRYAHLAGQRPEEIVPAPSWSELEVDLRRELEHLERHVAERDTDSYEATYAILNGSRILHAIETGDVAISKHSAGDWALSHLPERWHAGIGSAERAYDDEATPGDAEVLRAEMGPFVTMVREHLPAAGDDTTGELPRWSGY